MLRRLSTFIFGLVFGAILMWAAMAYHVVRTSDGFYVLPKRHAALEGSYFDVRDWTIADWSDRPDLAWTVSESGKTEIFGDVPVMGGAVKDVIGLLKGGTEKK
jgi:hypothetical protein